MTALSADEYAAVFQMDLHAADARSARTRQTASGQVGISDLGRCQEHTRRIIAQLPATDAPATAAAFMGHAAHDKIEAARHAANPQLQFNRRVTLTLPNGAEVPGTIDECDPDEPSVTDWKSKDGLADIIKEGSTRQQRWQRHGYYAALVQAGEVPVEGVVRNVYIDRSGQDERVHVEQEPYDPSVLVEMSEWLDDVFSAHIHGQEALKEKPRTWCRRFCQFYSACRLGEVEEADLTNDPLASAVDRYAAAVADAKEAEQRKAELRPLVLGVTGFTAKSRIQSTKTNKGAGSWRVEVSAL